MKRKIIKINFGCFETGLSGWINVDNARRHIIISKIPGLAKALYIFKILRKPIYNLHSQGKFRNIVYGDATKRMKFKSNSVDYIYSSHMLEHIYPKGVKFFLFECKRVLRKGGVLRLLLPDIEYSARQYLKSVKDPNSANTFSKLIYATSFKEGYKNSHKWMYDKYSLSKILKDVGFSKVIVGKFKKGSFPDVEKLDSHDHSLILEASK